ncbi:MAG: hypothetical protein KKB37_00325 [Alphaproteobacteria bacterium]|nr:hypothetical protein [Alphaproteobacteria bacterium]
MILSLSDRAVVTHLYPYQWDGVSASEVNQLIDAWYAAEHYDDNPAYTWNDNEEINL